MGARKARFILALIILLGVGANLLWISIDKKVGREEAINLIRSAGYRNVLRSDLSIKDKAGFILKKDSVKPDYGPLYYILPAIFPVNSDFYSDFARILNIFYLIVLTLFVYKIADYIFKDKRVALMSSHVSLCIPIVFSLSRRFIPTIAVMSLVVLGAYLLFRSEDFKDKLFSSLFIFVFIIGSALARYFPYYFIVPLVFIFVKKIYSLSKNIKEENFNSRDLFVFGTILVFVVLFSSHYMRYLSLRLPFVVFTKGEYGGLVEYLYILINKQMYLVYFIFLIIGLFIGAACYHKYKKIRKLFIFILGVLPIIFIILRHFLDFHIRFTAPYVVFYSILASFWIFNIKKDIIRRMLAAFLIIVSSFIFVKAGFGVLDKTLGARLYIRDLDLCIYSDITWTSTKPADEKWPYKQIAGTLIREHKKDTGRILIIPDIESFNSDIIKYHTKLYGYPLDFLYFWDYIEDFYVILFNSKYIFFKTGNQIYNVWDVKSNKQADVRSFIQDRPEVFFSNFAIIDSYDLPDGSTGYLYKRKGSLLLDRPAAERMVILQEALRYNPDSIIARILLARDFTDTGREDAATQYLLEATPLFKNLDKSASRTKEKPFCPYGKYLDKVLYQSTRYLRSKDFDFLKSEEDNLIKQILFYGK